MQNPRTGNLEPVPKEVMDHLDSLREVDESGILFRDGSPVRSNVARYTVGEEVEVKGGKFRIRKITKKDLILRGIPSE